MQRTRTFISVGLLTGSLLTAVAANAAEPAASVRAPAPAEAKRSLPAVPEQKGTKAASPDAAKKTAKGKPTKEKKPQVLAKELFGKAKSAADLTPRSIGWYAKGCLAGGVH
ncbi:MAG: hypothetical protein WC829_22765, partial [Hyphomicrobium sp.]